MHYGRRNDLLSESRPVFDVSVVVEEDRDVKFTYCREKEADYENEVVIETDLRDHHDRMTELTEQGFFPIGIGVVYDFESKSYHTVSCWRVSKADDVSVQ